jgi:excisionase family DNA binding protein
MHAQQRCTNPSSILRPMSTSQSSRPAPAFATTASYSTLKAAELLGVSVQTVQRWMDRGHLRGWRTPGGHRRVEVASVERLLNAAARELATVPPGREAGEDVAPVNVMLLDDSPDELALLVEVARRAMPQARCIALTNGYAALVAIGRELPDLLITDMAMPGLDGVEMIRSLRADPATGMLPIIAVSSYSASEIAIRFGAIPDRIKFLAKPLHPVSLRESVSTLMPAAVA